MSASQFIASLVSSLAWPAVVVTILVVFRRQFGTMLERLSRFKLGPGGQDAESDWERTEDTVRQSLSAARQALGTGRTPGGGPTSPAPGRLRPGPTAAGDSLLTLVDDRWAALESELRNVIRPSGSLGEGELAGAHFDGLLDIALRSGLLNAATVRSLDGLRHLRNLARADGHLTPRQAQDFAVLADAVSYSMRSQPGPGRGHGRVPEAGRMPDPSRGPGRA
jgi:hypothetical protein